ncbi:hypothetical protein CTAYLR_009108 [Chrysophaeum taylorii]|uniref:Uncharacterized protein n=1 Tax=Chrysophaeum taylorii TaxID=2483200 RepID=A0AAD7XMG5_9STRA|nr:hypothetical protein CTAYLR_010311 [Chrysophaeum taylorii]KAJ8609320.1 hypothetical protein CTAYLR_009108 [Chrysophaeum taylorii]
MFRWFLGGRQKQTQTPSDPPQETAEEEEYRRLMSRLAIRRLIVEVKGPELDRALAEDAVREARSAAALRGEVLVEDPGYNDSDVETDALVYYSEKKADVLRHRRRRPPAPPDDETKPSRDEDRPPRFFLAASRALVLVLLVTLPVTRRAEMSFWWCWWMRNGMAANERPSDLVRPGSDP